MLSPKWKKPVKREPLSERKHVLIWIFLALMIFLIANAVSGPLASRDRAVLGMGTTDTIVSTVSTAAPQASNTVIQPTPTKTPLPPEYLQNYDDTNGVVVGTVMLVVIILLGTLSGIRVRRSHG